MKSSRTKFEAKWIGAVALVLLLSACSGRKPTSNEDVTAPATGAPGGKTVDLQNVGEITGSVILQGTPPEPSHANMAAITSCAKGKVARTMNDPVVTGDGGTLANAFVYVKQGLESYSFPVPSEAVTIDQMGCQFSPHVIALQAGQNLEITNSDSSSHNIHPIAKNNQEWNLSQAQGAPPLVKPFARAEIAIPVKCNVHPWMRAFIAVAPNPYFEVTGKDGSFTLKNVPPGAYTLAVWHEVYGTSEQRVTVSPNESKSVTFTFQGAGAGSD